MSSKLVASAPPAGEAADVRLADWIAARPRRELGDLVRERVEILARELDERLASGPIGTRVQEGELLGHPFRDLALGHVEHEQFTGLRAGLRERRVLLHLLGDEGEDGVRRRGAQVFGDRLHVGRLPLLDRVDDHEAAACAEEPERVARSNRLLPARLGRRELLDRVFADPRPEAVESARDLRTVSAADQIDGLELLGHRRQA